MWQAVWALAVRRTTLWYSVVLLIIAGTVLLSQSPLGGEDVGLVFLGAVQGWVLAFRLFTDPPGVGAFVFSRPLSRRRLFWYRWLIGVGYQALTLLVLVVLLAGGLRQGIQAWMFHSRWYPMVRWYELSVLLPVGMGSLFSFQASCFVMLRNWLLGASKPRRASGFGRAVAVGFLAAASLFGVVVLLGAAAEAVASRGGPATLGGFDASVFLPYLAVLTIMTTLGSLHCYHRLEVEA
jgi:hypothetical protein